MADILLRVSRCPRMLKALNKMANVFGRGHARNQSQTWIATNLVFIVELSISLASLANGEADIGVNTQ